jgi:hypothetical protein
MVTTIEEMWAWRYKDNVRITNSEGGSYIGSVIEILEEEEVFGEDLLVLQIGEKSIKVFRKEEIIHIETDDGGQE